MEYPIRSWINWYNVEAITADKDDTSLAIVYVSGSRSRIDYESEAERDAALGELIQMAKKFLRAPEVTE